MGILELNKHMISSKRLKHTIQQNMFTFIIKVTPYACSCECMTYLTYLVAPQYLCINAWTYECMFMVSKQGIERKP